MSHQRFIYMLLGSNHVDLCRMGQRDQNFRDENLLTITLVLRDKQFPNDYCSDISSDSDGVISLGGFEGVFSPPTPSKLCIQRILPLRHEDNVEFRQR